MSAPEKPSFDIRALSRLSGVNASTIRTWESRYAVLAPDKTPTGRRLYDEDDVNRLILLKSLVDQGFRIATLSVMPMVELQKLRQKSTAADRTANWVPLLDSIEATISDYQPDRFRRLISHSMAELEPLQVVESILVPVLRLIGSLWASGKLDVGLEHMLSEIVRAQLMSQIAGLRVAGRGAAVGFATLSGEAHELGSLMACYLAAAMSVNTIYFGANMPPDQLAVSARRQNVALLVVSSIYSVDRNAHELDILTQAMPQTMDVWLGCPPLRPDIRQTISPKVTVFHDFATYAGRLSSRF